MEQLLTARGYRVSTARDDEEEYLKASLSRPVLVVISLGIDAVQVLPAARRIRECARLSEEVPVVVFSITSLDEGGEV